MQPCPTLRPGARQIVGQETLAELQRRLAPCGFYAHPNRPQDMFGYLGLDSVANQVWDHTVMERVAMRVEFTPIGMALDDVDANLMRTRKARSPACLTLPLLRRTLLLCLLHFQRCFLHHVGQAKAKVYVAFGSVRVDLPTKVHAWCLPFIHCTLFVLPAKQRGVVYGESCLSLCRSSDVCVEYFCWSAGDC